MLQKDSLEPIGHELFREAWAVRITAPRSAILIGIAGLEVGLKHCIARLIPDSTWLVEHVPTPPLESMLKNYLPKLPVKNTIGGMTVPPSPRTLKAIKEGIEQRNRTAHRSEPPPDKMLVERVLLAVADVLWMLDFYCGESWALDHISADFREDLGLEPVVRQQAHVMSASATIRG
jgi:hypothetical protein